MIIEELDTSVQLMLKTLKVDFKRAQYLRGTATIFQIEDFGLIVSCIDRRDYSQVDKVVQEQFKCWRYNFISLNDNLAEARLPVVYDLMRGGYLTWIRHSYPSIIQSILFGTEEFAKKIINERLRIWNNEPKYKFHTEYNKMILDMGGRREYSVNPSFFDFMPEENECTLPIKEF